MFPNTTTTPDSLLAWAFNVHSTEGRLREAQVHVSGACLGAEAPGAIVKGGEGATFADHPGRRLSP